MPRHGGQVLLRNSSIDLLTAVDVFVLKLDGYARLALSKLCIRPDSLEERTLGRPYAALDSISVDLYRQRTN